MDETLWCYHSNETSSAVLSHGTIYLVCSSNFRVCGWNPMVLPFKWNLLSSIPSRGTIYLVRISKLVLKFCDQLCDMTMQMKPHLAKLSGSFISYSYFWKWNLQYFWSEMKVIALNWLIKLPGSLSQSRSNWFI